MPLYRTREGNDKLVGDRPAGPSTYRVGDSPPTAVLSRSVSTMKAQ
jgi:hypothetical protein